MLLHEIKTAAGLCSDEHALFRLNSTTNVSVTIESVSNENGVDGATQDTDNKFLSFSNVQSLEECLPLNECLTLIIRSTMKIVEPAKDLSVIFGGQAIVLNEAVPYIGNNSSLVGAQIGDCEVTCSSDEALFEIKSTTTQFALEKYHVQDLATGEIVARCVPGSVGSVNVACYWTSHSFFHDRFCVPRSRCYAFVASQDDLSTNEELPSAVTLSYDGEEIEEFSNPYFEVADFGDACSAKYCDDDEEIMELLVSRGRAALTQPSSLPDVTWSLSTIAQNDKATALNSTGTIPYLDGGFNFYHRVCAPKGSCVELHLIVPETHEVSYPITYGFNKTTFPYIEADYYALVIDGVFYGDGRYVFDSVSNKFSTRQLGGECSGVDAACGSKESLLSMSLSTGPRNVGWDADDVDFSLHTRQEGSSLELTSLGPVDVVPERSFGYITCIEHAQGRCTDLVVNGEGVNNGNIADYEVAVDGITLNDACTPGNCRNIVRTQVGGSCSPKKNLSKGAIAGIAVGIVHVLALLAYLVYRHRSKRRLGTLPKQGPCDLAVSRSEASSDDVEVANTGDDEDQTSEDLPEE